MFHQHQPNPDSTWLSSKAWQEILALESLPKFKNFIDTFPNYIDNYKLMFESLEPHR